MLHTCIAYSTQQLDGHLFDRKKISILWPKVYLNTFNEIIREVVSSLYFKRI